MSETTVNSRRREFRGAWIATVANIDWPSRPGLPVQEQQAELIALLARAQEIRLNAIIFQVRPACDAFYASELEPWSEFLTGQMGLAPEPFYDPLAFAIEEAHKRGIELHAWFNPYRARHNTPLGEASADHISQTNPELVRTYGKFLWMDPADPAVQERSRAVIRDVVRRYDVDGIHFDDYFYPYQIQDDNGNVIDFPDTETWEKYQASGGMLSRNDWRRENVNTFIRDVYADIKAEKPQVLFGISPFGIWRPGNPPQIQGLDAYDTLYADARKWFHEGWVDYLTPQLYWAIDPPAQSFPVLLQWWAEQNTHNRHLWIGLFTSRVLGDPAKAWAPEEIARQIELTQAHPGASGTVHFSMKSLTRENSPVGDLLAQGVYAEPADVPSSPWLKGGDTHVG
jgi:uncharacterized lipoprotein YddW (UPF0748 family)